MTFYKIVDDFKKSLPIVEVEGDKKEEQPTN
jgi:hypothetical protein